MEKRRFSWFNILIYIILFAFLGLMIYFLIGVNNQQYASISTDQGIRLVLNDEDQYKVQYGAAVESGEEVQVYIQLDKPYNNQEYFTFTMSKDAFNVYPYEYGVDADGKPNMVTFAEALSSQIIECGAHPGIYGSIYTENWFISWLPTIISTVVMIAIAIFFFRLLMSSAGGNQKALDFNKSRARKVDDSKVRFDDVAGCDSEKAELVEVVDYLKEPKKYTKYGAKLPKGILLVGPPGTGKTLLAKAVAGEAGVPFYSISGSDFVEMFVGVGAGRVRDLFKTAKQNAPCVIFIDEIDAVGRQRGAGLGGGNDEREQTLNQLLVELDGFEENSGIIVIAATNRDDVLDPALLRAGRFDRQITVSLPDRAGREAIFKVHAKNKKLDPKIDFSFLAKRTVGFSGADIASILNDAAILAIREKKEFITLSDIDEAIDRRIAGPARSTKGLSDKERLRVAYHESGHAIIGLTLPDADKVRKITIIPRGRTGGHVLMGPDDDRFLLTKKELEAEICGLLGGRVAEEIFFNDVSTGASNDIERATQIARSMVVEYGMSSLGPIQYEKPSGNVFLGRDYYNTQKNFSADVANEIDREVRKIVDDSHALAVKIITERKDDMELIAKTLLENETITEEQITYLLEHRSLPSDKDHLEGAAKDNYENSSLKEEDKPHFDEKKSEELVKEDEKNIDTIDKEEEKEGLNSTEDKKD